MKLFSVPTRCERGIHKFEPRYDIVAPDWMKQLESITGNPKRAYEKKYVHDICVRCGKIQKRTA